MLTVGSLFSGIGGLELGLERAGMKVVWQVENDPYARKILEKHWPKVRRYEDIRNVHGGEPCKPRRCGGCLTPNAVDLICGGFPCQDISVAGKGKGIEGERSGLWKEFARIIGEVRPKWVLIENVPALRSRGMGAVLRDLSALGFDAEWDCLPASDFGAPFERERIFIVARADRILGEIRFRIFPEYNRERSILTGRNKELRKAWMATEPPVGRVAHGVSSRVDRLRCLGNAVVPQVAEHVGRLIVGAL